MTGAGNSVVVVVVVVAVVVSGAGRMLNSPELVLVSLELRAEVTIIQMAAQTTTKATAKIAKTRFRRFVVRRSSYSSASLRSRSFSCHKTTALLDRREPPGEIVMMLG
jgi:hypothetical protein